MTKQSFTLLFLIGIGLRIALMLVRVHPAGDEIWALYLAEASFNDIWFATLGDLHGPFYFLLLHLVRLITNSSFTLMSLRLVSLFFGILSLFGVWYLGTQVAGKRVGYIGFVLSMFLPAFVWPAVFARYYSFLIFLTIITTLVFIKYYKTGKSSYIYWLVVLITIGVYTHYYFSLLSLSFLAFLVLTRNKKLLINWIISQTVVVLLFSPCLYYLLTLPKPDLIGRHANSILKIPSLLITNIISSETLIFLYYFRNPMIYLPLLIALCIATSYFLLTVFKKWQTEYSKLLVLILIVPPLVLVMFAYTIKPFLSLGSLMIFILVLVILIAKGIEIDLNNSKRVTVIFILLLGAGLYFLFDTSTLYSKPRKDFLSFSKSFKKGDIVLHSHLGSFLLGSYYSGRENNFEIIASGSITPQTAIGVRYSNISPEKLRLHQGGVWYFESPYLDKKESAGVKSLIESEFTKVHEEIFTAVSGEISETYFNVYYYN